MAGAPSRWTTMADVGEALVGAGPPDRARHGLEPGLACWRSASAPRAAPCAVRRARPRRHRHRAGGGGRCDRHALRRGDRRQDGARFPGAHQGSAGGRARHRKPLRHRVAGRGTGARSVPRSARRASAAPGCMAPNRRAPTIPACSPSCCCCEPRADDRSSDAAAAGGLHRRQHSPRSARAAGTDLRRGGADRILVGAGVDGGVRRRGSASWRASAPSRGRVIEHAPRLRIIARHGVGVDAVDMEAATRRGIVVTTTGSENAAAVAEYTFALLLALVRKVVRADARDARRRMVARPTGRRRAGWPHARHRRPRRDRPPRRAPGAGLRHARARGGSAPVDFGRCADRAHVARGPVAARRCGDAAYPAHRRDRAPHRCANARVDEAGRLSRQHRARRARGRTRTDRGAVVRRARGRRARHVRARAAARGLCIAGAAQRGAVAARRRANRRSARARRHERGAGDPRRVRRAPTRHVYNPEAYDVRAARGTAQSSR